MLTVREILGMSALRLELRGGGEGLDRSVRWASSCELVDPTPWLKGGEIVLTTGLAFPESEPDQRDYVRRLDEAGASALGFGIGLSHAEIPAAVVDESERLGFPLLEIPLPIPFLAIVEGIASAISAQELERTRRLVEHQRQMTKNAVRDGAAGVLRYLTTVLGGTAVLLDSRGTMVASSGPSASELVVRARDELSKTTARRSVGISRVAGDESLTISALGVKFPAPGFLVSLRASQSARHETLLLGHANSLLSLELNKPAESSDAERWMRSELLVAIADGRVDQVEMPKQLRRLGLSVDERLVGLAFRSKQPADTLLRIVEHLMQDRSAPYLLAILEGTAVMLAPESVDVDEVAAAAIRMSRRELHVGIGGSVLAGEGVLTIRQAQRAVAAAMMNGRGVVRFDDLTLLSLLLGTQSREALETIAQSVLAPLAKYDAEHRGDLKVTLETLLAHNGQWTPTADQLGIHRHTLRHRADKIESLTRRSLQSADDRAELWLALKAHELQELADGSASD